MLCGIFLKNPSTKKTVPVHTDTNQPRIVPRPDWSKKVTALEQKWCNATTPANAAM
jgi:hypothetical protein